MLNLTNLLFINNPDESSGDFVQRYVSVYVFLHDSQVS